MENCLLSIVTMLARYRNDFYGMECYEFIKPTNQIFRFNELFETANHISVNQISARGFDIYLVDFSHAQNINKQYFREEVTSLSTYGTSLTLLFKSMKK